jgi:hypothetical protein
VFGDLPTSLGYNVVVDHIGSIREELSTFDLIILQRHILGIEKLQSQYQIIAGDANGSKKLNVSDLVAIRKVILGITNSFAPGVPSWRFVDKDYQFEDINDPFVFDENILIEDLTPTNGDIEFIGIKIGDINGSIGHLQDDDASSRSIRNKTIKSMQSLDKIDFGGINLNQLDGFQLNLKIDDYESVDFHHQIDEYSHTEYSEGELKIICYLPHPINIDESENLFSINTDQGIELSEYNFLNEVYLNGETYKIDLSKKQSENQEDIDLNVNYDYGTLNIVGVGQDFLDSHSLAIHNVEGKRVFYTDLILTNQISTRLYTGIHFVSINGPIVNQSFKIVAIH